MACIIPLNAPFSDVPFLRDLLCLLLSDLNSFYTEERHGIAKKTERQAVFSILVLDPCLAASKVAITGEKTFLKLGLKHAGVLKVHHTSELCEPLELAQDGTSRDCPATFDTVLIQSL